MVARFFLFLFAFALFFAFFGKWVVLQLKKWLNIETNAFEDEYVNIEFESKRCRSLDTHQFVGKDNKCVWCGISLKDAKEYQRKQKIARG